jgi:integrase
MGLGPVRLVKLSDARARALQAQYLLLDLKDPIKERDAKRESGRAPGAKTFAGAAAQFIGDKRAEWKNAKHLEQWDATIRTYVNPIIGHLPVTGVTVDDVIRILRPIWTSKSETAGRVRGRIERILSSAGIRDAENPATLREVEKRLPRLAKVKKVEHHSAVPWGQVPDLMKAISARGGTSSAALRFLLLTAARSGEVRGARWSEFDLKLKVWTVPGERMKAGTAHSVPLSHAALATLPRHGEADDLVFQGARPNQPLSDMSLIAVMRKIRGKGTTVHGLRSSFRDWVADETNYPRDVAEAALAHGREDKTEAAYLRSTLFEKRRALMNDWAEFVTAGMGAGEV